MKKLISIALLLALCLSLFAGCQPEVPETQPQTSDLENAATFILNMYRDTDIPKGEPMKAIKDFEVTTVYLDYTVEWSVTVTAGAEDAVKITEGSKEGFAKVDLNERPTEEVKFDLIATIKDAEGNSATATLNYYTPAVASAGSSAAVGTVVEKPEAGKPYKLGMLQGNLGVELFFSGTTADKDYYLSTTETITEGADVTLEEVDGGYRMFLMVEDVKTYIDIYQNGDYVNARFTTEPTAVFTWNEEYKTLTAVIGEEPYYLGTYKEYNTLSASKLSYAATSFPSNLYTVAQQAVQTTIVEKPVAGTAYKWGMLQGNLGVELFFAGTTANKDYYFSTTEDIAASVNVTLEEVDGGYRMFFMADSVKTYIDIYQNGDYVNARFTTEPTAVFTWNEEYKTLTAVIGEEPYYLGTYKEYNTLSASKLSYAATSFPTNLYTMSGTDNSQPTVPSDDKNEDEEPEESKPVENKPEESKPVETTPAPAPSADATPDTELTLAAAIALGSSKEHDTYTEGKYYVTGTIDEIYNTQYGNMKIKDASGNILTVYGTFSADGSTRFDAMATQPAVGATVKIYGIIGQYNGTAQIKNGWIVEQSGATTTPAPAPTPSAEPACVTTPEIGKAYKLGLWQVNKSAVYYFTGAMSGYYGATETDKALAVDVYLEDAGNGAFHIYFMNGTTKSYLYGEASGTHLNFKFGDTKGVFTWNAAYNTFMTTIGDTVVFMGTYSNYVTFGMSSEDKIDTSYTAHLYN